MSQSKSQLLQSTANPTMLDLHPHLPTMPQLNPVRLNPPKYPIVPVPGGKPTAMHMRAVTLGGGNVLPDWNAR